MRSLRHYVSSLVESGPFRSRDTDVLAVERRLHSIATDIGGSVGFAAIHIESGRAVSLNGAQPLPMASTVKLPIAMQVLKRVERGELAPDALLPLEARHVCPGEGALAPTFCVPGVALSIKNLLELALVHSDNTCSDALLELAGGPAAVVDLMNAVGIPEINIHRSVREILMAYLGLTEEEAQEDVRARSLGTLPAAVPEARRTASAAAFLRDPRDRASALSMARLLIALFSGRVLNAAHTASLLEMMSRCRTGKKRLRGLLPAGTRVAHKTGTLRHQPRITADVGIIYLPPPYGHCACAAFIAGSTHPEKAQNQGIARMARVVYDFLITHPE